MSFILGARLQPLTKSDIAKRMVWGIATSETTGPDHQGDIVDFNGSLRAFKAWERNVREMHTNKAVGRCVSVIPIPKEKKILVGVRVSDGAEDTWKKVLDGTLRAFSIGGYPIAERKKWNAAVGKHVNYIEDYRLTELSLCDSPANPDCRVTLLTKRNGQKLASDVLAEIGETMDTKVIEKARQKLTSFTEKLEDNDELVVIRKSDLVKGDGDVLTLKSDAPVETFKKDEAEGVVPDLDEEHEDEGGDEHISGEEELADLSAAAEQALEIHDVLHDLAGQECDCHGDDEGGEEPDHEFPEGEEDGVDKSLRARMRKNRMYSRRNGYGDFVAPKKKKKFGKKQAKKLISKVMGKELTPVVEALNGIITKMGGAAIERPMIRKGDGAANGETNGKTAGAIVKNEAKDVDAQAMTAMGEQLRSLHKEADELVRKRDNKIELTPTEQARLTTIGDELGKTKIAFQLAGGDPSAVLAK